MPRNGCRWSESSESAPSDRRWGQLRVKTGIEMRSALDCLAGDALGGPPGDLTRVIESDIGKWAPIVKALNLQTE